MSDDSAIERIGRGGWDGGAERTIYYTAGWQTMGEEGWEKEDDDRLRGGTTWGLRRLVDADVRDLDPGQRVAAEGLAWGRLHCRTRL